MMAFDAAFLYMFTARWHSIKEGTERSYNASLTVKGLAACWVWQVCVSKFFPLCVSTREEKSILHSVVSW